MSYLYATGRIRVREMQLLSASTVERMIGAPNAQEAYRALSETDYASLLEKYPNPQSVEDLVMRHLRDIRYELQKMVGTRGPLNIVWRRYDFHNLRVVIKSRVKNLSSAEVKKDLIPLGSRSRREWLNFYENSERTGQLRSNWIELYHEALTDYEQNQDPQRIDFLVDAEYLRALFEMTRAYSPFFRDYVRRLIDIYNVKIWARLAEATKFAEHFASGGFLEKTDFQNFETLVRAIAQLGADYSLLETGLRDWREHGSLAALDRQSSNLLTRYLKTAKFVAAGAEPVFSYWFAKKNNAMIVRSVIIAKLAGIPQGRIKNYLRKLY